MTKVIFFDLGGVIFQDFFSGGEVGLSKALELPSKTVMDAYIKTDFPAYCKNEATDEERWRVFTTELGLPEEKVLMCIDEFYKSYQIFPETLVFLENLKKENLFKLGILSDQPMGITKHLRDNFYDVFNLFDPALVIISAEVKLSKKDSDLKIYKLAIEKSRTSPNEILFIDNSLHNIKNAKSMGIDTYYFDIENQTISVLLKGLQEKLQI